MTRFCRRRAAIVGNLTKSNLRGERRSNGMSEFLPLAAKQAIGSLRRRAALFLFLEETMRNLKTIEKKVKTILEKNTDARNDDMVLYLALCNICLKDAGAMPLAEIMTQHKYLGLPSFESVSRTRRKLQAKYPELAGSRPTQKLRATGEKAYRKYAKE
mgnify:CR=1 FL=1